MRDAGRLSAETPVFLQGLRAVIEKIKPKDEDSEAEDEDQAYLCEKLRAMQAAYATADLAGRLLCMDSLKE